MPPKTNQPSDLELQLLSVLWKQGASTVRDVIEAFPDGKKRAYTTVLTVMQNLEKKGLVERTQQGTAHVYRPVKTKRETLRPVMNGLVNNVFYGKVSSVMQHLLEDSEVTTEELNEIRRLIDKRKREQRDKPA